MFIVPKYTDSSLGTKDNACELNKSNVVQRVYIILPQLLLISQSDWTH